MRFPRDIDDFDGHVTVLARAHGPGAAAAYCHEVLAADRIPATMSRAHALVQAGCYHEMASELQEARTAFAAAVDDGGRSYPDARCYLAGWMLEHGEEVAGRRLAKAIRADRPDDFTVYRQIGDAFETIGDLAEATRWLTAGATRHLAEHGPGLGTSMLLLARRGVRRLQGFTEDEYDLMVAPPA
ncbi:MAG: hypothetical protein ACR2F6_11000 [Mycobacteriales bacterium]